MYLCARTQSLPQYPILECLDVIARLGFDGVEVCLEHPDLEPATLTPELAQSVGEKIKEIGFPFHSVSYHKDYIYNDQELEWSKQAIQLTPLFGTQIFVFSGAFKKTGDSAEWDRTIDRTRELVAIAEDTGVTLAEEFEPNFVVGSTAGLLRLFDEIPSPNLAANMDLGHTFLCDPDPLEAIRRVGKKIVHCHIENMATGVHNHLLPQEGDMNLAGYIAVLQEIGFQGGLALDLYGMDYEAASPGALEYLRGLLP